MKRRNRKSRQPESNIDFGGKGILYLIIFQWSSFSFIQASIKKLILDMSHLF
jgi:hypothetical protein